jgi:hypothetical protein
MADVIELAREHDEAFNRQDACCRSVGPRRRDCGTGLKVSLRYASVKRFREANLVSEHLYFDQLEFLQQIGAMPS